MNKIQEARIQQRTAVWERLYDLGYVGHAYGGTKEDWVRGKLIAEGTLPAEPAEVE